jgi:streptomycin 6-kinase
MNRSEVRAHGVDLGCDAIMTSMFGDYLDRWGLTPDGEEIATHSSRLLPVRQNGVAAMLKIAVAVEEQSGGAVMSWWGGEGAARVLAEDRDAVLLERAEGRGLLAELSRNGEDAEASRIICRVVARLHAGRGRSAPPILVPLSRWFRSLGAAAAAHGGILVQAAAAARELLASPGPAVVLHGDIHHGNILDFGPRGWLAIDPKGLYGERGFDYANLFCNPDREIAAAPGRLARQASLVAEIAGIDRERLLQWVLAYAGLSAAWFLEDGESPELPVTIAKAAAAELAEC